MVEAALVSPIFILLVFGVLEFGVAYRDVLTVGDATTDAARVGAIQGPDVTPEGETADYSIVNAVRDGLAGLKPSNIEAIVVFKKALKKRGDSTLMSEDSGEDMRNLRLSERAFRRWCGARSMKFAISITNTQKSKQWLLIQGLRFACNHIGLEQTMKNNLEVENKCLFHTRIRTENPKDR